MLIPDRIFLAKAMHILFNAAKAVGQNFKNYG
jgi:hypothetical protein